MFWYISGADAFSVAFCVPPFLKQELRASRLLTSHTCAAPSASYLGSLEVLLPLHRSTATLQRWVHTPGSFTASKPARALCSALLFCSCSRFCCWKVLPLLDLQWERCGSVVYSDAKKKSAIGFIRKKPTRCEHRLRKCVPDTPEILPVPSLLFLFYGLRAIKSCACYLCWDLMPWSVFLKALHFFKLFICLKGGRKSQSYWLVGLEPLSKTRCCVLSWRCCRTDGLSAGGWEEERAQKDIHLPCERDAGGPAKDKPGFYDSMIFWLQKEPAHSWFQWSSSMSTTFHLYLHFERKYWMHARSQNDPTGDEGSAVAALPLGSSSTHSFSQAVEVLLCWASPHEHLPWHKPIKRPLPTTGKSSIQSWLNSCCSVCFEKWGILLMEELLAVTFN